VRNDDEIQAIQRCQRGEMAAMSSLIAQYQVPALRLAYLLTGDHALADDIVQESFLAAYSHIQQFDATRPFAPWFFRIVTNVTRMRQRSQRRHGEVSLEIALADEQERPSLQAASDPEAVAELRETREALHAALASLTHLQREAVILRYYYGYADQEIAAITGCRVGTARERLYSGLQALERRIRQEYPWLLGAGQIRSTL